MFKEAMDQIVNYRGGKLRVPNLQPHQYTYYVHAEAYLDALTCGYINEDGVVTEKFRQEYDQMFDRIGKIV